MENKRDNENDDDQAPLMMSAEMIAIDIDYTDIGAV